MTASLTSARPGRWHPLPQAWLLPLELIAASGIIVLSIVAHGVSHGHHHADRDDMIWSAVVGVIAGAAVLLWRHRAISAWWLASLSLILEGVLRRQHEMINGPDFLLPAFALGIFGVAAQLRSRQVILGVSLASALIISAQLLMLHFEIRQYGPFVSHIVLVAGATAAGLFIATRSDYVDALRERAERLELEQEVAVNRATEDERLRIARELHDVVAHTLTLMVVQASALGEQLGAGHPVRPTIDALADSGRTALDETRRMLGLLRPEPGAELAPQPTIDELPQLVEAVRGAGVEVALRVEGARREMSLTSSLSAYRIVQEALTNVIRHADATRVEVRVHWAPAELRLTIQDDGVGIDSAEPRTGGPGHGVPGMIERAALFGGTLTSGRLADGGWRVVATLPLRAGSDEVPAR